MKIDLHIHTTASDGRLTPSEVIRRAAQLGVEVVAITDHDSVGGIEEALSEARKYPHMMVIPGIEMGADVPKDEMHILGYFVDRHSSVFCEKLRMLRSSRSIRSQTMVSRLADMGIILDWDRVVRIANGASIGRPHIAQAILEYGYVSVLQEAFDKYLVRCDVSKYPLTLPEASELIHKAGGILVLAHGNEPGGTSLATVTRNLVTQARIIKENMLEYINGLECWHPGHDEATIKQYVGFSRENGLVVTGGSDCHQKPIIMGTVHVPKIVAEQIKNR